MKLSQLFDPILIQIRSCCGRSDQLWSAEHQQDLSSCNMNANYEQFQSFLGCQHDNISDNIWTIVLSRSPVCWLS